MKENWTLKIIKDTNWEKIRRWFTICWGLTCRFGGEPVKKRSKLVLPTPQISEGELDEVRYHSVKKKEEILAWFSAPQFDG